MNKHVYFVRHGQSEENAGHIFMGKPAKLTDEGREQAARVAERIERIGVDAILTSPYPRAKETAEIIGKHLGIAPQEEELFGEWVEPTSYMGKHRTDPVITSAHEAIRAAAHDHEHRHEDEETFAELAIRGKKALEAIEAHPAERLCVVSHASFLKIIAGTLIFSEHFTKREFIQMFSHLYLSNTGVTYARYSEAQGKWQVITWNDISHFG